MISHPISIYNNWSAYDELSDAVELTEELAMKQLQELLRLREHGVRFDYYLMDAFWFDPEGGYRTWRKPHWPNGPDRWIDACKHNGVKPGLWVSANYLCHIKPIPEWQDSYDRQKNAVCMFCGGFMEHFMETLQMWYDRGIRMFKFDFVQCEAATPEVRRTHLPEEIVAANYASLKSHLRVFREKNPDVVLLGYNGLGGDQGSTSAPFRKTVDIDWLTVFDSLYCGDARPADVPAMNYWRSMEFYSDHMVRAYERNCIPLERIDNVGFMIGLTGTCCRRGTAAWQGMLLMELARGGWVNHYYGNLELLDGGKARWFAQCQSMFMRLQAVGRPYSFGGVPGEGAGYGFANICESGALYAVVNPSQSVAEVEVPRVNEWQCAPEDGRILFTDSGFLPELTAGGIRLGPEQIALVGFGEYAGDAYDMGLQQDVVIPRWIEPVTVSFTADGKAASATIDPPARGDLRVIMQQVGKDGVAVRFSGGAEPHGKSLGKIFRITVEQGGRALPVHINYDKSVWSGLSWGVGEVRRADIAEGRKITLRCETDDPREVRLECLVYSVGY